MFKPLKVIHNDQYILLRVPLLISYSTQWVKPTGRNKAAPLQWLGHK